MAFKAFCQRTSSDSQLGRRAFAISRESATRTRKATWAEPACGRGRPPASAFHAAIRTQPSMARSSNVLTDLGQLAARHRAVQIRRHQPLHCRAFHGKTSASCAPRVVSLRALRRRVPQLTPKAGICRSRRLRKASRPLTKRDFTVPSDVPSPRRSARTTALRCRAESLSCGMARAGFATPLPRATSTLCHRRSPVATSRRRPARL